MSVEVLRKMKAVLVIAMLAGAEIRQVQQAARFGRREGQIESSERIAKEVDLMISEPSVMENSKYIAKQMDAMLANSDILDHAKRIAEQLEVLINTPSFQEQVKASVGKPDTVEMGVKESSNRLAADMETLQADPIFQDWAKHFAEQTKGMLLDPSFQKQCKRISKQMAAMMSDPVLQEHAKLVADQFQAQVENTAEYDMNDELADRVLDELVGRLHKELSVDRTDMENTALGRPSSLAIQSGMGVKSSVVPSSIRDASLRSASAVRARRPNAVEGKTIVVRPSAAAIFKRWTTKREPEPEEEEEEELISEELQENINEVVYLFTRLTVASVMIHHGYEKYFSADLFTKFGIDAYFGFLPGPHIYWTYIVGGIQFFAPFLMSLGVFSRAASASLAGVMAGAVFQSILSTGTEGFPLSKMAAKVPIFHNYGFELPIVYVCFFLLVAANGPGKLSVSQALGWNDDKTLLGKLKQ